MENFNVKVQLPSGAVVRVDEIKNKDYLIILKFCENKDLEGLNNFFNSIIFKNDLISLNIIDKFYLLIVVRMLFIDPNILFNGEEDKTVNFSLDTILDKIDCFSGDFDKTIKVNNLKLELGLPNLLYFNDLNDIYISTIRHIEINDKEIDFGKLTPEEKESILSYIPNSVFTHISNYINNISKQLEDFVVIEENKLFNIEEINVNILSNGLLNFIMHIFSNGLKDFFEMLYIFTNKMNLTGDVYYNITPLDTRVMFNIFNKDQEEREKQLKRQNHE